MLSRTAENLFWMARYLERAESTARLISMGQRTAVVPGPANRDEWRSVLRVTDSEAYADPQRPVTEADVVRILLLDAGNPGSIPACLVRARTNARSVRTKLTQEMWEALNLSWRKLEGYGVAEAQEELPALVDWVKTRASVFRGAAETGMLRHEGYQFLKLGGAIERTQMTLRLLEVKYYALLPETEVVGGGRDPFQWGSVLHAVSASRAFHHVYGGDYTPAKITDFLLANRAFPRSVAFCADQMAGFLEQLAGAHERPVQCLATLAEIATLVEESRNGLVFRRGLHETAQRGIFLVNRLGSEIAEAFHF